MTQRIANPTGWLSAISQRLGIARFNEWLLAETVAPVAIVDSYVTLASSAVPPLFGSPSTAGELVAPAANTRLADTGQLAAGNWTFTAIMTSGEGTGVFRVKRRNAADAADVWSLRFTAGQAGANQGIPIIWTARVSVAQNERLVIENPVAGTAGVTYQAGLFVVAG